MLELLDCLEEIDAVRVQGYEVIYYGQGVVVQYPESSDKKKPEGRSFHHGRFIQRLRWQAMQETNLTVVETTATELIKNGWTDQVLGVRCKTRGEKDFVCFDYPPLPRRSDLAFAANAFNSISQT